MSERERQKVSGKHGDVWPFVFMMDDSCVMWQNLLQESGKRFVNVLRGFTPCDRNSPVRPISTSIIRDGELHELLRTS